MVSNVGSLTPTRLPTVTSVRPTRPAIGATIVRIAEVELGQCQRGLGLLHRRLGLLPRGHALLILFLGHRVGRSQARGRAAPPTEPGRVEPGPQNVGLGLCHGRLIFPRVDFIQQRALLRPRFLPENRFCEIAADAGADIGRFHRLGLACEFVIVGNRPGVWAGDGDFCGGGRVCGLFAGRASR